MKTLAKKVLLLLCLLQGTVYAAQVTTLSVYFEKDKYLLNAEEQQKLLALKTADLVKMQGYTDDDGGNKYNTVLSQKRVEEVRRLVKALDSGIRFETSWFGEEKPVNANKGEPEKAMNRRVDVTYISNPLLRTELPVQSFKIDTKKEQVITCAQGTKVVVPAGAFSEPDVKISITEYYDPFQILSADLSTTSNGRPLESAGMIYITAESNGQKVEPQLPLQFKFPKTIEANDFKFFAGQRDSAFGMNWVTEESAPVVEEVKPLKRVDILERVNNQWNTANILASKVDKDLNSYFGAVHKKLVDSVRSRNGFFDKPCLRNSTVDITVNRDGTIGPIKTSYSGKNNEVCDKLVTQFVRNCLPKAFKPLGREAHVKLEFGSMNPGNWDRLVVRGGGGQVMFGENQTVWCGPVASFGSDHNADKKTDEIVLSSKQLGWVNCDRFWQSKLVEYTVKTDPGANVRLIMKKHKAYFVNEVFGSAQNELKRDATQGNYTFSRIPEKEDVLVICTKKEGDKLYLAIGDGNTSAGNLSGLSYKQVSQYELEQAIKNIKL